MEKIVRLFYALSFTLEVYLGIATKLVLCVVLTILIAKLI